MESLKSNKQVFDEQSTANSNIYTCQDLKEFLSKDTQFDQETFSKPYGKIDFAQLAKTVDQSKFNDVWENKNAKGKGSKQVYQRFDLNKGSVMGLGTSYGFDNLIIIRGIKSQFSSHKFQFGDLNQKNQLTTVYEELDVESMQFSEKKALSQFTIGFDVLNETDNKEMQSPQCMEQLKYITLLNELIALRVAKVHDPNNKFVKAKGFVKSKYIEKHESDFISLAFSAKAIEMSKRDKQTEIWNLDNPDKPYEGHIQLDKPNLQSVKQMMSYLNNKEMDIVLAIDSSCCKKEGKNLLVMPSLKIVQIVMSQHTQTQRKRYGLNMDSFAKQ